LEVEAAELVEPWVVEVPEPVVEVAGRVSIASEVVVGEALDPEVEGSGPVAPMAVGSLVAPMGVFPPVSIGVVG
jgi:hypothetical protein